LGGQPQGLTRFDPVSNSFKLITNPSTGKQFPEAWSITQDEHKNIWFTTPTGIIKYNLEKNESITYGLETGVNGNNLTGITAYKDHEGKLYFGDGTGYFAFYPEELLRHSTAPEIVIDEFNINNKIIHPGTSSALQQPLWKTKEINLSHDQNVFSFAFAGINYSNPSLNKHLYKLENYDNDWRVASNEHIAYYFNVPPGNYIFKVKASNNAGIWAEKDITIIIHPPWWQTWWAYTFYGLCLIAGIFFTDRIRRKVVIERERAKTKERELAQAKEIEKAYKQLEITHETLKATQSQLIQSEKMASLGELTAGIAHEIQNPLNFVNNFSEVNKELLIDMNEEIEKGNYNEVKSIAKNVTDNEDKIIHHGKRADVIVKGMLQLSRSSRAVKELTDINALADEYLRLSYHGLRAKDKEFNATMNTDFDTNFGKINIIPQDIGRVLLNLYNNAFYAVSEKKKQQPNGYEPTISVTTKKNHDKVELTVKDNGNGISQKVVDKIFQPFFTTKPTGEGTGLGLSLSYDIIKAHGGEIKVNTIEGEFTEFVIQLPISV
jgi:signal transduction histidine kinase